MYMFYIRFQSSLTLSTVTTIRVSVDKTEDNAGALVPIANDAPSEPIYYTHDNIQLPTYLIPPNAQSQEEVILDVAPKPATYLLPPSSGKQTDYYYDGTGTDQQSDWYPVAHVPQNSPDVVPIILPELNETEALIILDNARNGKVLQHELSVPTPSTKLEPPAPNAPNDYVLFNSGEVEYPVNGDQILNVQQNVDRRPYIIDQNRFIPRLQNAQKSKLIEKPLHFVHKAVSSKHKKPTKLYPKKYVDGFKPVPIPVSQFAEDYSGEVPKARPLKPFHPIVSINNQYHVPTDGENVYQNEQLEEKRKEKEEKLSEKVS